LQIRQKAKEFEIGEIFIISCLNGLNISEINSMNIFNRAYKSPPNNLESKKNKEYKRKIYLLL